MVFLPLMEAYFTPCGAVEASAQGAADLDVGCREGCDQIVDSAPQSDELGAWVFALAARSFLANCWLLIAASLVIAILRSECSKIPWKKAES